MEKLLNSEQDLCNAELVLADDFGDNPVTFHCGLLVGHDGSHKEEFEHDDSPVAITWYTGERERKTESANITSGE